jgi:hypothetical protein
VFLELFHHPVFQKQQNILKNWTCFYPHMKGKRGTFREVSERGVIQVYART